MESINNSPIYNSFFPDKGEDNRVVQSGSSGTKIVSEGDTSKFTNKKSDSMGKDQFLQLLVTQLRYQDPMNPSSDQEFAAQLAQFSALESNQNIEKSMTTFGSDIKGFLESQAASIQASSATAAASLIGKMARVDASVISSDGVTPVTVNASFNNPAARAFLRIEDKDGRQISQKEITNSKGATDLSLAWDGTNDKGVKVDKGDYRARIVDSTGKDNGIVFKEGRVDGIGYLNGETQIRMGGKSYSYSNLKQVNAI